MESLSGAHEQRILKAAREQIIREFEELTEVPAEAPLEAIVQQCLLIGDVERRRRFEQGKSSGKFSLLSGYLSDLPDEEKEEFFRTGWLKLLIPPERPKKPWDYYDSYYGNQEWYREDLYNGVAYARTDLRTFAGEWLEELLRVGYHGVTSSGLPLKQQSSSDSAIPHPLREPLGPSSDEEWLEKLADEVKQHTSSDSATPEPPREPLGLRGAAYPVRFQDTRQVLWLQLDGPRSLKHGHREVVVSDEPLRTDKAILAALTAMEARPTNIKRLHKALRHLPLPLERPMWEQWHAAREDLPELDLNGPGEIGDQVRKQLNKHELLRNLQHQNPLDYVLLLLRHHRPGFDDLPQEEKLALIEGTCDRINRFLKPLQDLLRFLEYGASDRQLRSKKKGAEKQVKAAVLSLVHGLSTPQIAEELGEPVLEKHWEKTYHPTAAKWVKLGTELLERALGKQRLASLVEDMKAEARRYNSLSEAEQDAESRAENLGISYEEALRIAKEEEAYIEERRTVGEPGTE